MKFILSKAAHKAIDVLDKQFTSHLMLTGEIAPPALRVSRCDFDELRALDYLEFIPDKDGKLTIPTYHGVRIVLNEI